MPILVSGSIAEDYLMQFDGEFSQHLLKDNLDALSVNFNISSLFKHQGGAGHNISYNLWLLWHKSLLLWAVWQDFQIPEYNKNNIDYTYTHISENYWTPSAHIITDSGSNQITTFYPWASIEASEISVKQVKDNVQLAIVSPNNPHTMKQHVLECNDLWIPVFFDPWQPLTAFSKEQLRETLDAATYIIVNEYEFQLLMKILECSEDEIIKKVKACIITLAEKWAKYITVDEEFIVPAVVVEQIKNPTGAWDAFRAWLLFSLYEKDINDIENWKVGMALWAKLASACIAYSWTQEHKLPHDLL